MHNDMMMIIFVDDGFAATNVEITKGFFLYRLADRTASYINNKAKNIFKILIWMESV